MRVAMFCHSLISDWNHGNAHFLRGIATELLTRDHDVRVYEPWDAWSLHNLVAEQGEAPIHRFLAAYPGLWSIRYRLETLDLNRALDGMGLVLVHEWSDQALVRRIGEHRRRVGGYRLLFHDTHHRSATDPQSMAAYDLTHYDRVLAFGEVIRDLYLTRGWTARAWIWHEAADTRVFRPMAGLDREGDVVWIGNWGDAERSAELFEFLARPVQHLGLKARVYGVRYPTQACAALSGAGIAYGGWLPNYAVPQVFARFKATVHVPRRPYVQALPGIPTIRPFEALACGIPLVCAPWDDVEGLFTPGKEILIARTPQEMLCYLRELPEAERVVLGWGACVRVLAEHTAAHRAAELEAYIRDLSP
jgi:spore maturation protein CgeB